ncbi:MAG: hypothetical protein WCI41_01370 [bacterium]
MFKNKKTALIVLLILVAILIIFWGIYFYQKSRQKNDNPVVAPSEWTEQQRVNALKELKESSGSIPVSNVKAKEDLKKIKDSSPKSKSMTQQERLNLLNSLK